MMRYLSLYLFLAVVMTAFFSLSLGSYDIGVQNIILAFLGLGPDDHQLIIQDIRLPRVLLAVLVGAGLGLSGAALQGLLKNPLAEPGVLGVSSGAGLGAVVVLYYGLASVHSYAIPLAAFIGAGLVTAVLYYLASRDSSILSLILAGVALSSLMASLTALALNLSPNPYALNDMMVWLMGSLTNRSLADVSLVWPFVLAGAIILWRFKLALRIMALGDDVAQTMGVDIKKARLGIIIATSLMIAASVGVAGVIGFVGIVVPHIMRPFVGYDPAKLLLPSALGGALMLLLADLLVRTMPGGQELRVGVVTALVGGPFFLWLVLKSRRFQR